VGGFVGICFMDTSGKHQRILRQTNAKSLAWSPNGRRIAFFRGSGYHGRLYVARPNGTARKPVISWAVAFRPDWSPDGKLLAYSTDSFNENGPTLEIMLVPASGGQPHALTTAPTPAQVVYPSFSPNGKFVVYQDGEIASPGGQLWVIGVDGQGNHRLTQGGEPAWQRLR
jgi:Tol biopolymer transport system component